MSAETASKEQSETANIHRLNLEHQERLSAAFKITFDASVKKSFAEQVSKFESSAKALAKSGDWEARREAVGLLICNTFEEVVRDLLSKKVLSREASVLVSQEDHYRGLFIDVKAPQPGGGNSRSVVSTLPLWPADTRMEHYDEMSASTPWKSPADLWKCLVYRAASKISLDGFIEHRVKELSRGTYAILNELHHTVLNKPRMGFLPGTLWLDAPSIEGVLSAQFVDSIKSQITKEELEKNLCQRDKDSGGHTTSIEVNKRTNRV